MAKLLVIDDDADVRMTLDRALRRDGHDVVMAVNGRDGLKQYHAAPADLVICDLFMPEQDGIETILALRKLSPEIPIIAISGEPAAEVMLPIAQKLGARGIWYKPFGLDELLAAVRQALQEKTPAK